MKYKARVKYWAIQGITKGKTYIPKDYHSTRLHVYTDKKEALKHCVGNEIVVPVEMTKPSFKARPVANK